MNDAAFDSGVRPGGLFKKSDIKLLVAYILSLCSEPFTSDQLGALVIETGLANYFEAVSALCDLAKNGSAVETPDGYVISDRGRVLIESISNELPFSVREQAAEQLKVMQLRKTSEYSGSVELEGSEKEHSLTAVCTVKKGDDTLLCVKIPVENMYEAERLSKRFTDYTDVFYKSIHALMTGEITLCQNL